VTEHAPSVPSRTPGPAQAHRRRRRDLHTGGHHALMATGVQISRLG